MMTPTETADPEEWLDEYLRVLTRTTPWAKRGIEDVLRPYAVWAEQHGGITSLTGLAEMEDRYADEAALPFATREQLSRAVRGMIRWAGMSDLH